MTAMTDTQKKVGVRALVLVAAFVAGMGIDAYMVQTGRRVPPPDDSLCRDEAKNMRDVYRDTCSHVDHVGSAHNGMLLCRCPREEPRP